MLACISPTVIKTLLVLLVSTVVSAPRAIVSTSAKWIRPIVTITTGDDGAVDTTAAKKKAEEKKKQEGSVKISITNRGVTVDDGKKNNVILEFDSEEMRQALEELDDIGGIGEDLARRFEEFDDASYFQVRGSDFVRFGEDIHIDKHELIKGDVVCLFGDIDVQGKVMGDVVAVLGDVELGPRAIVNGEVVTVLGELDRDPDARVWGETVTVGTGVYPVNIGLPHFGSGLVRIGWRVMTFVVSILLFGIVIAFLSDRMKRSSSLVFGAFFKSLGIGALVLFVGAVLVGILAAIFSITIIGIPVAVLLVLSFVALLLIGYFVGALALGRTVAARMGFDTQSSFVHGIIGLFLLALFGIIAGALSFNPFISPFGALLRVVGGFISLIALLVGIGAFIASKAGAVSTGTKPQLPE
ncbi:MAG: hypothetical protein JW876_03190 [Candidatus Krumholzibacteriota bacterium]|nr:hypothetical protein [Candidatus Krumholzibacteriota bacterium]